MLRADELKAAAGDVVAAALLSQGWEQALLRFARAAGARDAVLMRNSSHAMVVGVATEEATETVAAFAAGRAPPNSRYDRVKPDISGGFRIDHDDYTDDLLARDPFYNEFLRPVGLFWHANAVLSSGANQYVELSLKRQTRAGPYSRADAYTLDAALPELRAAARIAEASMRAEARGMARLLSHRGGTVLEFDGWGRLVAGQPAGENDPASPFHSRRDRLCARHPMEQASLDAAIARAVLPPGQIGLASLSGADGRPYVLQVHPIPNRVRDVFLAAAAIGVLIERDPVTAPISLDPGTIQPIFDLTDREADVTCLLAEGVDLASISRRLRISRGTVRSYLKNVFEKAGVSRQAELVALLSRLRP
ncbi:helix-turn-helix transcriptional regulator [Mesorhizobium sp. ASY16-5R]|uniref:helix-turn-helix transcriptional regulator n=1 Tax=Mesorhizobium sp. ASY16-5R TaxID=3445772 RepID=UPI003FA18E85